MGNSGAAAAADQPEDAEPSLPGTAGHPETEVDRGPVPESADESAQHVSDALCRGFERPIGAIGFNMARAVDVRQIYGLTNQLDRIAGDIARTQSLLRTSLITKLAINDSFIASTTQAVAKAVIASDLTRFNVRLPVHSASIRFPNPGVAGHILPAAGDLGFLDRISSMVGSWDRGLLDAKRRLAASAAAMLANPYQDLFRGIANLESSRIAAVGSLVDLSAMTATGGLVDLLRSWRRIAETGLGVLRGIARAAYLAALHARDGVLNGDDGPVAWFIEEWLSMRVTPERIEAVSAALLEDGWDVGVPENHDELLAELRKRSVHQARVLRPIWENQLNYRSIGSLDRTITTSNGTIFSIADLVPDPQTTEALALANQCEEQRLRMVLRQLRPDELLVTNVYAENSDFTWAEAARVAGVPDPVAMGERVRRKLKRLGVEQNRRHVQTGAA